jgi:hypothetical protein
VNHPAAAPGLIATRALGPGSCRAAAAVLSAAIGLIITGCGSSATSSTGRASPPAANPAAAAGLPPSTPAARRRLRAQELTIHRQVLAALHAAAHRHGRYGGIPAELRRAARPVDRTVTADARHPALAVEGLAVRLRLPGGEALATVVGPYVPHRLQGTGVRTTPTRFLVRLAGVSGRIPLSPRLFTITDELGQTLRPTVRLASGAPVTAARSTTRSVTLTMTATLPIGNGTLRYSPSGSRFLAAWDFDVETD